jgi:predicted phage terminase large subunit-like protein
MMISADEYRAITRRDFYTFLDRAFRELNPQAKFLSNWHIELMANELERCRLGETKRLIINVPPRSLKSHCATVAFPAFVLGHDPTAQIICASYGQDLANKHAADCRTLMASEWYEGLFPTRLSSHRQALQEFTTTANGFRLATSVEGAMTGRGAGFIIIDDPLKPDEALSETQRKAVNEWFDHTLYSRLNDKRSGCIIIIMQRLHEDDLVGHVLEQEVWKVLRLPAIAEEDEIHRIETPLKTESFRRRAGEALHPDREPLEVLEKLRRTLGEYNFAGQYQQAPAPLGGGLVKAEWFKTYTAATLPIAFELVFQSWDTANKSTELSDYSVCTTWGVKDKKLFLLHVLRKRLEYPGLKRAVHSQAASFRPKNILIEDKASGTQLIQELRNDGLHAVTSYDPIGLDKIMRLHSVTNTIENGFVYLPDNAEWLALYIHELTTFPNGKYDDQADSTSQALDWIKGRLNEHPFLRYLETDSRNPSSQSDLEHQGMSCPLCHSVAITLTGPTKRCTDCGYQWGKGEPVRAVTKADVGLGRRNTRGL